MKQNYIDIHQEVTDKIIAAMENNPGDWCCPWHRPRGRHRRPFNVASRLPYHSANVVILWVTADKQGYTSGVWGTELQWSKVGAHVRAGEKGTSIIRYWKKKAEPGDDRDEEKTYFRFSSFEVFAAEQVDGYRPEKAQKFRLTPIQEAENFVIKTGATITHDGEDACYISPPTDSIQLPPRSWFTKTATSSATESYYSTLLHELTHWTSEPTRCNRPLGKSDSDPVYAREELIAELGAAFLCADLDVADDPRVDHAKYIKYWLGYLKDDKNAIITAAIKAEKATAYLESLQAEVEMDTSMCLIREILTKNGHCSRSLLIKQFWAAHGYERLCVSKALQEKSNYLIRTAISRGIIFVERPGKYVIYEKSIDKYERDFLKKQFYASLGNYKWRELEDSIRNFARWLGFRRTGPVFKKNTNSLINVLVKSKRIDKANKMVRRFRK